MSALLTLKAFERKVMIAALENNIFELKQLLDDCIISDNICTSASKIAASKGHTGIVRCLLVRCSEVNSNKKTIDEHITILELITKIDCNNDNKARQHDIITEYITNASPALIKFTINEFKAAQGQYSNHAALLKRAILSKKIRCPESGQC